MKSTPWILFAIALCYILYLQNCNKPSPSVPQSKFDALQQKYNDTLEYYNSFRRQSDSAISNAAATAIQAGEQAQQSQAALDQERAKNGRLLVMLDSVAYDKPDSTWVQVSPRYRDGCDSLRKENLTLNYRVMQYEHDKQDQVTLLNYEVRLRDSIFVRERGFNAQFQLQLDSCIARGKQQEQASKPRAQLYGGMAIWGKQGTLLDGGEVNIALKTPRDQIYEIKGAYLNTWWVGLGTKFKFHF